MYSLRPFLFLLLFALLAAGCRHGSNPVTEDFGWDSGEYSLTWLDESDSKVAEGILDLGRFDNNKYSGSWKLRYTDGTIDTGRFAASLEDGNMLMNFHPGYADNNVFATANRYIGSDGIHRIAGSWEHTGLLGPMKKGSFYGAMTRCGNN